MTGTHHDSSVQQSKEAARMRPDMASATNAVKLSHTTCRHHPAALTPRQHRVRKGCRAPDQRRLVDHTEDAFCGNCGRVRTSPRAYGTHAVADCSRRRLRYLLQRRYLSRYQRKMISLPNGSTPTYAACTTDTVFEDSASPTQGTAFCITETSGWVAGVTVTSMGIHRSTLYSRSPCGSTCPKHGTGTLRCRPVPFAR